jgi:phage gpG-like protein
LLSVAGTAVSTGGKGKRKGARITGAVRSMPGEPPRKQTGRLRSSVMYETHGLTARVGTNVKYGKKLELGTKRGIAARPWLRRALAECMDKINGLLAGSGE